MMSRFLLAAALLAAPLGAAPPLTTIQDVLYKADGTVCDDRIYTSIYQIIPIMQDVLPDAMANLSIFPPLGLTPEQAAKRLQETPTVHFKERSPA